MIDSLIYILFYSIIQCNTCIEVKNSEYKILYDTMYQVPALSIYSIDSNEKIAIVDRGDWLESEKYININTPEYLTHFYKTGYDRGHLIPLINMKYSEKAMDLARLDINMTKQNASFNRGIWREIEEDVTEIIDNSKYTTVLTGVTYERNEIPPIPIYYYKIVFDGKNWYYWLCKNKSGLSVISSISNREEIIKIIKDE